MGWRQGPLSMLLPGGLATFTVPLLYLLLWGSVPPDSAVLHARPSPASPAHRNAGPALHWHQRPLPLFPAADRAGADSGSGVPWHLPPAAHSAGRRPRLARWSALQVSMALCLWLAAVPLSLFAWRRAAVGQCAAQLPRMAMAASSAKATEAKVAKKRSPRVRRVVKTTEAAAESVNSLKEEQREVLASVMQNEDSVFITGKAGTGKSFLLRVLVKELYRKYGAEHVFVTATTGQAACAIGGTTLHYFAGLRPFQKTAKEVFEDLKDDAKHRWRDAEVLVVDEISMLDGQTFDLLNEVGQRVRRDKRPFGGIQLVLCGDFYQLPPVKVGQGATFCFEALCWEQAVQRRFLLTEALRQTDANFLKLLNEVRHGQISEATHQTLQSRLWRVPNRMDSVPVTVLYPTNTQVDEMNEAELAKLTSERKVAPYTYTAVDEGEKRLLKDCSAPVSLKLVVGAQVVLLKNLEVQNGLTNGTRGEVIGFTVPTVREPTPLPVVKFHCPQDPETVRPVDMVKWDVLDGGFTVASRRQLPLRLAWAMTIHRCQGMTLPKVQLSLGRCFAPGMAYVALSRATDLEGLYLLSYSRDNIRVEAKVHEYHQRAFPALEAAAGGGEPPPDRPLLPTVPAFGPCGAAEAEPAVENEVQLATLRAALAAAEQRAAAAEAAQAVLAARVAALEEEVEGLRGELAEQAQGRWQLETCQAELQEEMKDVLRRCASLQASAAAQDPDWPMLDLSGEAPGSKDLGKAVPEPLDSS
eukprot:EG_transcript_3461